MLKSVDFNTLAEQKELSGGSGFMKLIVEEDPLKKREIFAVSLRKDKKKSILAEKRKKISLVAKKNLN